jgi:ornithine cyclodeaminase
MIKLPQLVKTQFLSVQDVATLINRMGLETVFKRMASYIHEDYLRWHDFEKCARVANHSSDGVIELMPISDAKTYAFKYVNGHPKNTAIGLPCVMAYKVNSRP